MSLRVLFIVFVVYAPRLHPQKRKKGTVSRGRKKDERRIKPREGCEAQEEVERDEGSLQKDIYKRLILYRASEGVRRGRQTDRCVPPGPLSLHGSARPQ